MCKIFQIKQYFRNSNVIKLTNKKRVQHIEIKRIEQKKSIKDNNVLHILIFVYLYRD